MSISDTQSQLFGEPSGDNVTVETSGRVIRPLMALPDAVIDEARLTFDADGMTTTAVDPANVAQLRVTAHPEAFDDYTVSGDEVRTGVDFTRFTSQLANARMGKSTDDAVSLDIDSTRTLVTTEREYPLTTLTQTNEVLNIDPDSVREPPTVPDISLPVEATIDVQALIDALESIDRVSDHAAVVDRDGDLVLAGKGDSDDDHTGEYPTVANFGTVLSRRSSTEYAGGAESVFSLDYFYDMAAGLKKAKIDEVTIAFGEEIPFRLEFERTIDGDVAYEGVYLLAPRIKK